MEIKRLLPDHFLKRFLSQLEVIPLPVKDAFSFIARLIHIVFKVHVVQTLLHTVPFIWVEHKHLSKEVKGGRVRIRVYLFPVLLAPLGLLSEELAFTLAHDEFFVFLCRRSQHPDSALDLIEVIIAREQWSSSEQLCEDASYGPYIECFRVVGRVQDDFGRAVPPRHHILGKAFLQLFFFVAASQSEITDLQVTRLIQQHVGRLQVPVDDVG